MFDWLENFESMNKVIAEFIKPEHKILMIGCGNARLSEDLYDAGYENIWNTDISSVVIE